MKAQDNISKRAAIEKESLTLEKDKEDQILMLQMGKHSKFSSYIEWRLGENVVLRPMECLTPTVKYAISVTISHLFVS